MQNGGTGLGPTCLTESVYVVKRLSFRFSQMMGVSWIIVRDSEICIFTYIVYDTCIKCLGGCGNLTSELTVRHQCNDRIFQH